MFARPPAASARSASRSVWPHHRCSRRPPSASALGAGAGKVLHHKIADQLGEQAGETIPLGGAGLIVAYSHSEAEKIEPAVKRAVQKTIGEAEGSHVKALKGALADAQKKLAEGAA